jgi:hypothetical protein
MDQLRREPEDVDGLCAAVAGDARRDAEAFSRTVTSADGLLPVAMAAGRSRMFLFSRSSGSSPIRNATTSERGGFADWGRTTTNTIPVD